MAISDGIKNVKDREQSKFVESPTRPGEAVPEVSVGNTAAIPVTFTQTPTTATQFNVSAATAGTEYSQVLPANTKGFIIRSRNRSNLQLAYTSGQTGTTYLTIPAGASYEDSNLYTAQTIYFQASKNVETIEIIAYT